MPSGRVHKRVTVPVALISGVTVGVLAGTQAGLLTAAGGLATIAIHPDLDLVDSSWRRKIARPRPSIIWWAFWLPYARSVRHRSPLSHWPIMGTLFRVLYMLFPLLLGFLAAFVYNGVPLSPIGEFVAPIVAPLFLGMAISDAMHWFMDKVF